MKKFLMVVKQSRLQAAGPAARQLLADGHPSVSGWQAAHDEHMVSVDMVAAALEELRVDCRVLQNPYHHFDPSAYDVIVAVGGDGTFLSASHSVGPGKPVLGVNSDPERSRGFFCGLSARDPHLAAAVERAVSSAPTMVDRMSVSVNGVVKSKRVLNEALFCHPNPAATSRFSLCLHAEFSKFPSQWEDHVSSGFWIGPGAGTTGAMASAGGTVLPLSRSLLQLVDRETVSGMTRKAVTADPVLARVRTDEAVVHMDGPFRSSALHLGDEVLFSLSDEPLSVLGSLIR